MPDQAAATKRLPRTPGPDKSGPTLQELLTVEDDPAFVGITPRGSNVLGWPAIRATAIRLIVGDLYFGSAGPVDLSARPALRRASISALRSLAHEARVRPTRSAVLILANGAGLRPSDAGLLNPYVDGFAQRLGSDAWTVESVHEDRWPKSPRANARLSFAGYDRLRIAAAGQLLARTQSTVALELVRLFEDRAQRLLGWRLGSSRRQHLIRIAARRLASYEPRGGRARQLLDRVRPQVALVPEGCDGQMAVFNSVALDMGVHVAEYQHGFISAGHDTYNVAPTLQASEAYRRTQPVTFLAYGPWWIDQFNAPVVERVAIGNPNYSGRGPLPRKSAGNIIVLGDGIETEKHISFARELQRLVPNRNVRFRPHPWERHRVNDGHESLIDRNASIYESFRGADVVVAEASTAMFEAVGLVPNVLAWRTKKGRFYMPENPFVSVLSAEDAAEAVQAPSPLRLDAETFWSPDWQVRLTDWLRKVGVHVSGDG